MECKKRQETVSVLDQDLIFFASNFEFKDQIKGKTVLVTGATGLIGSLLVKGMLALNSMFDCRISIIALARNPNKTFAKNSVIWILQDITQPLTITAKVNYIFHCAAVTSSSQMMEHPAKTLLTTFEGTAEILRFARYASVESTVFLSSIESYGSFTTDKEISEEDSGYINPLLPRSCYPIGKKAAETLCSCFYAEYDSPVKIARLTQTFGPGVQSDDNRVFAQFARSVIEKKPIVLHTEGTSSKPYCYTVDALNALFYILFKGQNGEAYNVANPSTYISIRDMAEMVASKFGAASVKIEKFDNLGYAPPTLSRLGVEKLLKIGWEPRYSLEEMFTRLIDYFKETKNERTHA